MKFWKNNSFMNGSVYSSKAGTGRSFIIYSQGPNQGLSSCACTIKYGACVHVHLQRQINCKVKFRWVWVNSKISICWQLTQARPYPVVSPNLEVPRTGWWELSTLAAGNKGCLVHKGFQDNTGYGLKSLSALYHRPEPEILNNVCDKILLPEKNQLLWLLLSCTNINVSSKLTLFVTYPLINIIFSTQNLTQRAHSYTGSPQLQPVMLRLFGIILTHAKCNSPPNTYGITYPCI